jgi:hypothetical protein
MSRAGKRSAGKGTDGRDTPAQSLRDLVRAAAGGLLAVALLLLWFFGRTIGQSASMPAGSEARLYFGFSSQPSGAVAVRAVGFRAP